MIVSSGDPFAFFPGQDPNDPINLSFGYLHMSRGNCADEECDEQQRQQQVAFAP